MGRYHCGPRERPSWCVGARAPTSGGAGGALGAWATWATWAESSAIWACICARIVALDGGCGAVDALLAGGRVSSDSERSAVVAVRLSGRSATCSALMS